MGMSVYNVQKYFKLVEESGNDVFLPRGFLSQFTNFFKEKEIPFEIVYDLKKHDDVKFQSSIQLTLNQSEPLESALKNTQGVIVAPPGSGKTMIGMELIARKSKPALVLVHRKQLLDQWVHRNETFLNIPRTKIGILTGTKKKVGIEITLAI